MTPLCNAKTGIRFAPEPKPKPSLQLPWPTSQSSPAHYIWAHDPKRIRGSRKKKAAPPGASWTSVSVTGDAQSRAARSPWHAEPANGRYQLAELATWRPARPVLEASMHKLMVLFVTLAPTRWAIRVAHFLTLADSPTIYYGVHGVLSAGFGIDDARCVQVVKARVCRVVFWHSRVEVCPIWAHHVTRLLYRSRLC